jgi:polar amino acid transport system substrate-binding protein
MPCARLLEGRFMAVQQAVGVPRSKAAAIDWLNRFVEAARTQGFVAQLIEKFGVNGLSVA